jgi:hypothetical protein
MGKIENRPDEFKLHTGPHFHSTSLIKEFILWYIAGSKGRIRKDGRPIARTVLACAERLFCGLENTTQKLAPQGTKLQIWRVIY